MEHKLKYIYGPVPSWRVGSSLGIDPLSQKEKICSYDCLYCQLGKTKIFSSTRQLYISEEEIAKELEILPASISIDYITVSGRGEPTLASNLGYIIKTIKKIRKEPIAVITNSSIINRQDVLEELSLADFVIAKLDASSQESLAVINQPVKNIKFDVIIEGIKEFKRNFNGKLALQIMFTKENAPHAANIAKISKEICPDEVQINTPLRPCGVQPLGIEELSCIKNLFDGLNSISVYESHKKAVQSISDKDTLKRRGKV